MADKRLDEITGSLSIDTKVDFITTKYTGAPTPAGYEDFRYNIRNVANWINALYKTFTVVLSSDTDTIHNGLFVDAIYIGVYSGTRIINSGDNCFDESGNAISPPSDTSFISSIDYPNGDIIFTSTRTTGESFTIDVIFFAP